MNQLLLQTGADIPFIEGGVTIHQPSAKEISMIGGEEVFFLGCQLLGFSKKLLNTEDNSDLEKITNFEVLMSIANDKSETTANYRLYLSYVLALLFPEHTVEITKEAIFIKDNDAVIGGIFASNFEKFRQIVLSISCLNDNSKEEYNPQGELSKRIAKKLEERKRKLAQQKDGEDKVEVLGRYISILSVGLNISQKVLSEYTIYQLFDEYQRYRLKLEFDIYIQAKLAGAKDLEDVDDWMKDLHS